MCYLTGLDQQKVYLKELESGQYITIDSTVILEGKFFFSGKIAEPEIFIISIEQKQLQLMIGNENVVIKGDWNLFPKVSISGSEINKEWVVYNNTILIPARTSLIKLFGEMKTANENNDTLLINILHKENDSIYLSQLQETKNYILQHNNTYLALSLLDYYWKSFKTQDKVSLFKSLNKG